MKRLLNQETGQALVFLLVLLPVFLGLALVLVDGSQGFVAKRQMQNAADAAALAAARDLQPALGTCDSACVTAVRTSVKATVESYSDKNGGPAHLTGGSGADPAQCNQPSDTNCYTWPYNSSNGKVEVRLQTTVNTFFTSFFGIAAGFLKPKARAVGSAVGITETHCDIGTPPVRRDDLLPNCQMTTITGGAPAILFAYDNYPLTPTCGGGGSVALSMAGSGNTFHGSVYSNGGVSDTGSNNGSPSPPSDSFLYYTDPCTATNGAKWGTVQNKPTPIDWPVPVPTLAFPGAVTINVTNKALASTGVATLTTSGANNGIVVGDSVTVSIGDPAYDGTYTVTAATATTFQYSPTPFAWTVTNKAIASGVATLTTSAQHDFASGAVVTVAIGDARFDGSQTVTSVPTTTTFKYTPTALTFSQWSWNLGTNTATLTRATAHGLLAGDSVTVSGMGGPYMCLNGTFTVASVTSTAFTYSAPACAAATIGTQNQNRTVAVQTTASAAASGTATATTLPSTATSGTVVRPNHAGPTSVTDDQGNTVACTDEGSTWTPPANVAAGVYCASTSISLNGSQSNGAAFIAPAISVSGGATFVGYSGLYANEGGLLLDGYGSGITWPAAGASSKGAIFAPAGKATVGGSSAVQACPGQGTNSCGFIEGKQIVYSASTASYQGLGPPIGGTPHTITGTITTTIVGANLAMDE